MKIDYNIEGLDLIIEVDDTEKKVSSAQVITAVRESTGMNRKEFAQWLNIPYRTFSDWEKGLRVMPDYVLRLIAYKTKMEKRG